MTALAEQNCIPLRGAEHRVDAARAGELLAELPGWGLEGDAASISRKFRFPDYVTTIAFVNAVATMAEAQDHHPDLEVGYGRCLVRYNTHDVGGLSQNDFICAAKADALADN